eukprot:257195_1
MIPAVVTDPSSGQPVVVSSLERQRVALEKEINDACSEFLNEPDWNKNMAIVDQLNRAPYLCPFAIKAIRFQLKTKNPEIEILALELAEAIIKNCPSSHAAVAQEDFMRYLVKVGTDKRAGGKWTQLKTKMKKKNQSINSKHIRSQCIEKALLILKMLAMAYSDSNLYPVFRATVRQLEGQQVRFPETNKDESLTIFSPIHTGGPTAMGSVQNPNLPMIRPVVLLEDVHHYELVQAQEQADLLFSMINAPVLSFDLIPDLTQMLNQSQQRIVVMISEGTADENVVMQALQVNDIVNQVLEDAQAIVNGTKRRYQEEVDVKKLMKRQDSDQDVGDGKDDDDDQSLERSISLEEADKQSGSQEEDGDDDDALFAISPPDKDHEHLKKRNSNQKKAKKRASQSQDLLGLNVASAMTENEEPKQSEENILDFLGVGNEAPQQQQQQKAQPNKNNAPAQVVFDPLADPMDMKPQPVQQEEAVVVDEFSGLEDPFAGMPDVAAAATKPIVEVETKPVQAKAQANEDIFAGLSIDDAPQPQPQPPKHEAQNSDNVILDMFTGGAPPDPNIKEKKKENPFNADTDNPFGGNNGNAPATDNKENPFDALENPFNTESLAAVTGHNAILGGGGNTEDDNPFALGAAKNKQNKEEEFMGDRDPFADM